jgi:O-antigen/teichoic acid export membrane protein
VSIVKNTAFALSGSLASRAIQFVTIIISARFLSPDELAVWPLFLILTQIPSVIGMLRLDIAITLARQQSSAALMASFALGLTTLIAMLTTIGAYILHKLWPNILGIPISVGFLPLIFLHIVATNLISIQQSVMTRQRQFRSFAIQSVAVTASTLALILGFQAFAGLTPVLFILAQVLGLLVGTSIGMLSVGAFFARHWRSTMCLRIRKTLLRYKAYPVLYTPYSLSQVGQERLVNFLVVTAFGLGALGKFFLVRQLFVATANLFAQPMRQLLFSYLVDQRDRSKQADMLSAVLALILSGSAPLLFILPLLLQPILVALAGEAWRGLDAPIILMSWIGWVIIGVSWIDRIFDVAWKQKTAVALQIISDAIILGVLGVAVLLALPFATFLGIYSSLTVIYYLLWATLALYSYHPQWLIAMRPPIGAAMGLVCGFAAMVVTNATLAPNTIALRCLIFAIASFISALVTMRLVNSKISIFNKKNDYFLEE